MRDGFGTDAFAARPKEAAAEITIENYRAALCNALADAKILSKKDWVKAASKTPIYEKSRPTAKLLLLVSAHDALADGSTEGLLKRGRANVRPTVTLAEWNKFSSLELEHVAPQSPDVSDGSWENAIYESKDLPNCLGNLTVVPKLENIVISNRPWTSKRALYRVLGARTFEEFNEALANLPDLGVDLSKRGSEIIDQSVYAEVLVPLAAAEKWDSTFILKRSERLCELAWDELATWLPRS